MNEVRYAISLCCGASVTRTYGQHVAGGMPAGREFASGDRCDQCGQLCRWKWSEWEPEVAEAGKGGVT